MALLYSIVAEPARKVPAPDARKFPPTFRVCAVLRVMSSELAELGPNVTSPATVRVCTATPVNTTSPVVEESPMVSEAMVAVASTRSVAPLLTKMVSAAVSGVGELSELTVTVTPLPSTIMFLCAKALPAQASRNVPSRRSAIGDRDFVFILCFLRFVLWLMVRVFIALCISAVSFGQKEYARSRDF